MSKYDVDRSTFAGSRDRKKPIKLILVGPDCSGKSTLAEMLGLHYQIKVMGHRKIKDKMRALQSIVDGVFKYVRSDREFIMDQWQYPVDIVYENVLGSGSSPMASMSEHLIEEFNAYDVLVLHITASNRALSYRYSQRGDELWDIEQILKVAKAYKPTLQELGVKHSTIDTSTMTPDQVLSRAVDIIDKFYKEC
ncbi:hypothetical protein D3C76_1165070 [compost metagenome]